MVAFNNGIDHHDIDSLNVFFQYKYLKKLNITMNYQ